MSSSFTVRVQYKKSQIIKILDYFAHCNNIQLTTQKYRVCKSQVYRWRKNRALYEANLEKEYKRMGKPGRRALFPDLEQELYKDVILIARHVHGDEVDGVEVRRRMMELVQNRMGNDGMDNDGMDNDYSGFSASSGWLRGWMKRFNITLKTPNASIDEEAVDQLQVKQDKLESFKKWYVDLKDKHGYKDSLIINMDETPVWYEPKVCKVVEKRDVDLVVVKRGDKGDDRARVTAVLAVSRDGTMLQPTVIHKSKIKVAREQPGKTREERGQVALYKQESNCMTSDIMVDWIEKTLVPHVEKERVSVNDVEERCLLIMDSFSGHRTAAVKETLERHGIDLCMIPGGMTKHLQPLDIAVNRSFKSKVKGEYWKRKRSEWKERGMEGDELESSCSSVVRRSGRGRPRKGQVSRAAQKLEWIVEDIGRAAGLVSEVVVKNGWRKMEEWRL